MKMIFFSQHFYPENLELTILLLDFLKNIKFQFLLEDQTIIQVRYLKNTRGFL